MNVFPWSTHLSLSMDRDSTDEDNHDSMDTDSISESVEDSFIVVQPVFQRYIKHFKMRGNTYRVKVRQFDGDPADALQYFGERLDEVTERVLTSIPDDDHISVHGMDPSSHVWTVR